MARSAAEAKKRLTRILHSKEYEIGQMSVKDTAVESLEAVEGKDCSVLK